MVVVGVDGRESISLLLVDREAGGGTRVKEEFVEDIFFFFFPGWVAVRGLREGLRVT